MAVADPTGEPREDYRLWPQAAKSPVRRRFRQIPAIDRSSQVG